MANEINGFSGVKSSQEINSQTTQGMSQRAQKISGGFRSMVPKTKESHKVNKDGSTTTIIRNAETNQIMREINFVQDKNGKIDTIHSVTIHSVEIGKNNEPRQVKTTFVDEDGDGYADSEIVEKLRDGHWVADAIILPPLGEDLATDLNRKMSDLSNGVVKY